MKTLKKWLPTRRKVMQLYFGLLLNANLKGFLTGNIYQGPTKQLCVPGINCYSCPGAIGACPLGSLQGAFSADRSTLYYVGGILLLQCLLFGRMLCGWVCPFGLIQELLYKIKTPKLKKSPVTRVLSWLKYVVLVFFVFLVPLAYAFRDTPLPAFCKYICPVGTLEGGLGLLSNKVNESYFSMLGPLFTWKFLLLVSIVVGAVFVFRLFCRFLCPLGALYGLFNRLSVFGVGVDQSKCVNCGLCVSHCKVDIRHVGDQECVSCGECIPVCPTKAITYKGIPGALRFPDTPQGSKKRTAVRWISALVLLAVLLGAIGYYWNAAPAVTAEAGSEVGNLCYGYDLELIDGTGLTGTTLDPTKTGKITVVNFWGTWCTPCVGELPYFDQIAREYADTVTVVAIHTHSVYETAPDFITKYYPDSPMLFAKDYPIDDIGLVGGYYTSLGGRGTFPYTLVLDENGIITHVFFNALEYEDLKQAVEASLS